MPAAVAPTRLLPGRKSGSAGASRRGRAAVWCRRRAPQSSHPPSMVTGHRFGDCAYAHRTSGHAVSATLRSTCKDDKRLKPCQGGRTRGMSGQRSPKSRVDLLGVDPSDYGGQRSLGLERLLRLDGAPTRTGNCDLPGAPQPWLCERPAVRFVSLLPPTVREPLPA